MTTNVHITIDEDTLDVLRNIAGSLSTIAEACASGNPWPIQVHDHVGVDLHGALGVSIEQDTVPITVHEDVDVNLTMRPGVADD